MPDVVIDSTVLVSAFLAPTGTAAKLLNQAHEAAFRLHLSEDIVTETQRVLTQYERIRRRYRYADERAIAFCQGLRSAAHLVTDLLSVRVVARDPHDDMVIACALKASARYLVTRDKDLLTLGTYRGIRMVTPRQFLDTASPPNPSR